MHNLIPFIITECVLALIIWAFGFWTSLDGTIKAIIRGVVILVAVLYLIQFLGLYNFGLTYLAPHIGG